MIPAASTTALVTSLGSSVWTVLYDNLPVIFGILAAVAIVFWAFHKLLGFFKGGRR